MDTDKKITDEKDEKIAHLEKQLAEITEAQKQMAATIALNPNSRTLSTPKRKAKSPSIASGLKTIFGILVLLVLAVVGFKLYQGNTIKQESVTYVERVQALATLATAEAHMKTVLQVEDNKIFGNNISFYLPGTKRKLLLIVPATVIAGVDLNKITSKDMVINEETKEINITLPHAGLLLKPSVDLEKIQKLDDSGLLSGGVTSDEWDKMKAKAQKQISQEAISVGLLDTAEENAEKALKEVFKNIGYTINVTFK